MRYQKHRFWTESSFYRLAQRITASFFGAFGKLESQGSEHIPRKGGVLLVSNHLSYIDPPLIGTVATRGIYYMTRDDVFRIPGLNKLIMALNAFPVRRGAADRTALRHTLSLLNSGKVVLIFPEGTRSVDGTLGKAHAGVSFIVHRAKVPTIPVFLEGIERMMPHNAKCFYPAKLSVTFGPSIDFAEVRAIKDRRERTRCTGELIMKTIGNLRCKA
jgi:1-acyl-sn-glycerol-3-phosphate acyltransferase